MAKTSSANELWLRQICFLIELLNFCSSWRYAGYCVTSIHAHVNKVILINNLISYEIVELFLLLFSVFEPRTLADIKKTRKHRKHQKHWKTSKRKRWKIQSNLTRHAIMTKQLIFIDGGWSVILWKVVEGYGEYQIIYRVLNARLIINGFCLE